MKNRTYLQSLHKKQGVIYNPYKKYKVPFTIPTEKTRIHLQSLQKKQGSIYNPCKKNKVSFTIPTEKTRHKGALAFAIFGLWS